MKILRFDKGRCVAEGADGVPVIFRERRAGLVWPGASTPGYLGIWGIWDHLDPFTGQCPVQLVEEIEESVPADFFRKLTPALDRWRPAAAYADLSDRTRTKQTMFAGYLRSNHVSQRTRIVDMNEYRLSEMAPTMRDWLARKLVMMSEMSAAYRQLRTLRPDDLRPVERVEPEDRMFAAAALGYVVASLEMYPAEDRRERRKRARKRGEGYQ